MADVRVTDPELLKQLEAAPAGDGRVTDPALLAQLEGKAPSGFAKTIDDYMGMVAKGLSFGYADRIAALGDSITGRGSYDENLARNRSTLKDIEQRHPIAAPVTETVAGMAGPVGAVGAIGKGVTLGQKIGAGALAGMGFGAVQGAAEAQDFTDLKDTAKKTATGASVGTLIGFGIPVLGRGAGVAYNAAADAIRGRADGISSRASSHLIGALTADNPMTVRSTLRELGDSGMLADAGPALLGKAQGASLNSDDARAVLARALTERNRTANPRLANDVNGALGPATPPSVVDAQLQARQEALGPLYDAAVNRGGNVDISPAVQQLARAQLYAKGTDAARLRQFEDLLQTQGPQGRMVPEYDPRALQRAKFEMDAQIARTEAQTGSAAAVTTRDLTGVRRALNDAMAEQLPGYAEANLGHATAARARESLTEGGRVLSPTIWPQEQAAAFNALPLESQAAYRVGARGEVEKQLGNKANDLVALSNVLKGEGDWNRAKLVTTFGEDATNTLIGAVDREKQFRDTFNKVVENSQTAQRTSASNAMKVDKGAEGKLISPESTFTGMVATLGKKGVQKLLQVSTPDPTRSYGEIARVLSSQGSDRERHISALVDAFARRQQNKASAGNMEGRAALAAALLADGYRRHLTIGGH